jgi:hypothetical protein
MGAWPAGFHALDRHGVQHLRKCYALHNLGRCAGKHGSMREVMPSLDRRLYALAAVFQGEKIQSCAAQLSNDSVGFGAWRVRAVGIV